MKTVGHPYNKKEDTDETIDVGKKKFTTQLAISKPRKPDEADTRTVTGDQENRGRNNKRPCT